MRGSVRPVLAFVARVLLFSLTEDVALDSPYKVYAACIKTTTTANKSAQRSVAKAARSRAREGEDSGKSASFVRSSKYC